MPDWDDSTRLPAPRAQVTGAVRHFSRRAHAHLLLRTCTHKTVATVTASGARRMGVMEGRQVRERPGEADI